MKKNLVRLSIVLFCSSVLWAEPDRSQVPRPTAARALEGQRIHKTQLSNGVAVWTVERHGVPVVSVNVLFEQGADSDPAGKFGLASFATALLEEGAAGKSSLEISDELDFLGAELDTSSDFDYTALSLEVPSERLAGSLDILADIVLRPDFPLDEIARIKEELLTDLRQERDEADSIASYFFPKLLYPQAHRYSERIVGSESAIETLTQSDLKAFHGAVFRPEQATILVVGDVSAAEVTRELDLRFAAWKSEGNSKSAASFPEAPQLSQRKVIIVDKPGAAQTVVRIGWQGVARQTKDYYALEVLNTVLGDSFTSRLNQNLREKNGYAYGAGSAFDMRKNAGPFYATAAVQTDKTGPAIEEFQRELRDIQKAIPKEELEKAKNYLAYRFPSDFETNSDIAGNLAELVIYSLPDDTYAEYVENIQAVTSAQVEAAAKKYIDPERMVVLLVGDRAQIEEEVKALNLGPVEYRDSMEGLGS